MSGTIQYTIRPYDTIWMLAQIFNTTVDSIMELNPGVDPRNLYIGQVLTIRPGFQYYPSTQGTPAAPGRTGMTPGQTTAPSGGMRTTPGGRPTAPGGMPTTPGQTGTTPGQMMPPTGGTRTTPGGMTTTPGGMPATPGGTGTTPGQMMPPTGGTRTTPGGMTTTPGGMPTVPSGTGTTPGQMMPPSGGTRATPGGMSTTPGGMTTTPSGTETTPGQMMPPSGGTRITPDITGYSGDMDYMDESIYMDSTDGIEKDLEELRDLFRMLWEQHVTWTRMAVMGIVHDLPEAQLIQQRLLRNPEDFANALMPFYGEDAARDFEKLLTDHLTIAAELVKAVKAGDSAAADDANKRWHDNADQIAAFLASVNPYWSEDDWSAMLDDHLNLLAENSAQMIAGKYEESINGFDDVEMQALEMADVMADGIAMQFAGF